MNNPSKYEIVPGCLAIWGDVDRPCARMMVMVMDIDTNNKPKDRYIATVCYIAASKASPQFNRARNVFLNDLEPIENFGVVWEDSPQDNTLIKLARTNQSVIARYPSGQIRPWQGEMIVAVAPSLWDAVRASAVTKAKGIV